ncbi:MAG: DUF1565 domain-containing protein, partial [Planctomycetes bacterium]|nr:DUF1565 domain-containing protein [Planctomycetota bacterium]
MSIQTKTRFKVIACFLLMAGVSYACNYTPVAVIADSTKSVDAGVAVEFDGSGSYDPDPGGIADYDWDIPSEAYDVSGQGTDTLECRFSPDSGQGTYVVKLRVKDSTGDWSHVDGEGDECAVTVADSASRPIEWYVDTNGDDYNEGLVGNPLKTIQRAIGLCDDGDTVHVAEGTYYENINFGGKNITVTSTDPNDADVVANTIIAGLVSVVTFEGGEDPNCTLSGFTITSDTFNPALGLVSHWKLDETSGPTASDSSGNGYDGTLENGPEWDYDGGQIEGALLFDGSNDYVDIGTNVITTTEFTVSGWAERYGPGGGDNADNLIFQQRDMGLSSTISLYADKSSYVTAVIRSDEGGTAEQSITYPMMDYDEWHYYTMTVDANNFILYIDGKEVARTSNNQTGDYDTSIDYVQIGRSSYSTSYHGYFNGSIDDVRIYDRALTDNEVYKLYALGGGDVNGGGIRGNGTEATIRNCVITGNTAEKGGGVYDCDGLIEDCVIENNMASYGAGLYNFDPNKPIERPVYWSFDDEYWLGYQVSDTSEANTLVIAGDTYGQYWDIAVGVGDTGECVKFNGRDSNTYLEGDPVIDRSEPFSVFIWAKTDVSAPKSHGLISQQQTDPNTSPEAPGYNYLGLTVDGELDTNLFTPWEKGEAGTNNADPNLVVDLGSVDFSEWHQYGLVWDGSKRHLYFDGDLV